MNEALVCIVCGEPFNLTDIGLVGQGGVCRNPDNPNQDDEGTHLVELVDLDVWGGAA